MRSACLKINPILSKQQWNEVETISCLHFIGEQTGSQKGEADSRGGGGVGDAQLVPGKSLGLNSHLGVDCRIWMFPTNTIKRKSRFILSRRKTK